MQQSGTERRKAYLSSKRGDLTSYASMVGQEFEARVDQLAQLVGHEPSVGAYKESLLRGAIAKFIPKRYSVGTGFVVFTRESRLNDETSDNLDLHNLKEHYTSRQLDIVVYDDYSFAPLLKDGEFVVLRPESVRSIVEVKGYIKPGNVRDTVDSFIDFGRKWIDYAQYRKRWGGELEHFPTLLLLAWNVYVDNDGRPACDGKTVRQEIVKCYRDALSAAELASRNIPLLDSAYLYNECVINRCGYFRERDQKSREGYSTSRGKFIRYDSDRKPTLSGDCTIASLLASIHLSLETPFNSDFSYFDQSMQTKLLAHECAGITDWDSGEEADA